MENSGESRSILINGKALHCLVCSNGTFYEGKALLNTRMATFINFDWANKQAIYYSCYQCGYIHWFKK